GREIRRAFVADAGWSLVSADYSQIELRILAHLSEDEGLVRAFAEKDRTLRVGIIRYKSDNESVPAEVVPFSYDVPGIVKNAENSPLGGFSGALRRALEKAASELEWQPERKKTILFLGDIAPVESEVPPLLALAKDLKRLDEIQIFTIPVFNPGEDHRDLYRRIAEAGGGASVCYRPGFKLFYPNAAGALDEKTKIPDLDEALFRLTACARAAPPAPETAPPTPGPGRP
ncbi:MAG: DNA polymerase, partial [Planctomycetota bacterium]